MLIFFSNPERAHPCAEPRRLTYIVRENRLGGLGCGALEEPKKKQSFDAQFRQNGKFDPLPRPNPLTDRHQKLHNLIMYSTYMQNFVTIP